VHALDFSTLNTAFVISLSPILTVAEFYFGVTRGVGVATGGLERFQGHGVPEGSEVPLDIHGLVKTPEPPSMLPVRFGDRKDQWANLTAFR